MTRDRFMPRGTHRALVAAFLTVLLAHSTMAAAPDDGDPAKLIESHRQLTSERARLIREGDRNLALKRSLEKQYEALEADRATLQAEIAAMTEFCTGRFDEPELSRRRAICAASQVEFEHRETVLARRQDEVDGRDKARQADGVRIKTAFEAVEQKLKSVADAIARLPSLASFGPRCVALADKQEASRCLQDGWKTAGASTREFVDLQTGDAFRDGSQLRRSIDQTSWPVLDKYEVMSATYLAELGRYEYALHIVRGIRATHPADPLLQSLEAQLAGLAERAAKHPAASPHARTLAEELKIAHLPAQARAAVMLALLAFREGDYDRSVALFRDAEKSRPQEAGVRDMAFLAEQARLAREQRGQPGKATDRAARAMQREGALAASNLADFLMEADNRALTELALGEARERLARIHASADWAPYSLPSLKLMDEMIDEVRKQGTARLAQGTRLTDRWTKADFMLDALSYGQKSWTRSLRYLEIAMTAAPKDPRLRQAYDELSAIAASAK